MELFFEDSSSDDYNDDLVEDDEIEYIILMVVVRDLEENKKRKRPRSQMSRLCIYRNRALGHEIPMDDYFAKDLFISLFLL